MKEYCTKKIYLDEKETYLSYMANFDYHFFQEEVVGDRLLITLERETETEYYNELKKIEAPLFPKFVSIVPIAVFCALAFLFITVFVILFFTNKTDFNLTLWFCVLFVPAIICILISGVFFFKRTKQISYYYINYATIQNNTLEKARKLRERYAKENEENQQ